MSSKPPNRSGRGSRARASAEDQLGPGAERFALLLDDYERAVDDAVRLRAEWESRGYPVTQENGTMVRPHPLVAQVQEADRQVLRFAGALRVTPEKAPRLMGRPQERIVERTSEPPRLRSVS